MDNNVSTLGLQSMAPTREVEMFLGQTQWIRKYRTEKSHMQGYKNSRSHLELFWTHGLKMENQYWKPNLGHL